MCFWGSAQNVSNPGSWEGIQPWITFACLEETTFKDVGIKVTQCSQNSKPESQFKSDHQWVQTWNSLFQLLLLLILISCSSIVLKTRKTTAWYPLFFCTISGMLRLFPTRSLGMPFMNIQGSVSQNPVPWKFSLLLSNLFVVVSWTLWILQVIMFSLFFAHNQVQLI